MKKYNIILIIFASVLLFSCKKETVEIDSMQVLGDEFYQGQVVNVGMSVKTSDPDNTTYDWWCEEGSFNKDQQGYHLNRWTAPRKNGEFLIQCTVTCGNTKQVRQARLKVNSFFFDRFAGTTLTAWSVTSQNAVLRNKRMDTQVANGRTTDSLGYAYKTINVTGQFPPMSVTSDVGISNKVSGNINTPLYPITSTKPGWDNFMGIGFTGRTPAVSVAPSYYINQINFVWWPTTHILAMREYFDPSNPTVALQKDAAEFESAIIVGWTRRPDASNAIPEQKGFFTIFLPLSASVKMTEEMTKNVGMSIDSDYSIKVYLDKTQIASTDELRSWRVAHNDAPFELNQFVYTYPNYTRVYMKNLVIDNSTEMKY